MTIMEALSWANNKLKITSGVEAPMLDAQLLLAHILETSKTYLFTHFDQELLESQLERFEGLITRRQHHEPIAYILGEKEFYGRVFLVNPFVLIPRPETELLIDIAKQTAQGDDLLFVDVGTGSGTVAVTLAAETGRPVLAIDTSPRALSVAAHNANRHQVDDRIQFFEGSLITPIERQMVKPLRGVVICANLPYLATRQWQGAPSDVKEYEPREALDGGVDGLDLYSALFRELNARHTDFPDRLVVIFEIDPSQAKSATALVKQFFYETEIHVVEDLAKKPRIVYVDISQRRG